MLLIRLSLPHDEFAFEVLLPDAAGLSLDPAFDTDLPDPAKVVELHIVGIPGRLIRRGRKEDTGEIGAIAAVSHALRLDAIQCCAPLFGQMEMLPVLLKAAMAGDFIHWNTHLVMNRPGQFRRQIPLEKFAVETVQTARRR